MWDIWRGLDEAQRNGIVLALPLVLFLADLVLKWRLKLSLETGGSDLALAALGITLSALLLAVPAGGGADQPYVVLLATLLVGDIFCWLGALSLASVGARWAVLGSYALGFAAVYSILLTVLQYVL